MHSGINKIRMTWGICLVLALVTLVAYWKIFSCEFVDYDDPFYVVQNPQVQAGLSWGGLGWAFTTRACDNWHPLTWLSLMLDYNLYGLSPTGFHATNLALHILNTVLLFLLLQRMTGATWRSAFVAALFALHPIHVESVAWVSERKDVLSTFFGLLTLHLYVRYAEKPAMVRYWPVPVLFALGLMAKPMLVTVPFLLLLLDFWPLRRMPSVLNIFGREIRIAEADQQTPFGRLSPGTLVLEKMPLLVLSVVSSFVTIWAQTQAIAMAVPLKFRLLNAALSYLRYLVKTVYPHKLYIYYPYPNGWSIWYPVAALLIVGWISMVAVRELPKRPYVYTGWFWFLGTLVPVIGVMQVGMQSMADRYTYLPLIGLFIIVAWLGHDLAEKWRLPRVLPCVLGGLAIAACIPLTIAQVGFWKNSFTLSEHALRLNPANFFVEVNLAMSYEAKGDLEPAADHLARAAKINPYFGETYNKLGWVQVQLGRYPEAIESFQAALQNAAAPALAHYGLALAYEKQGKLSEATEQIQAALALEPGNDEDLAEYNLIQEIARQKGKNAAPPPPASHKQINP